MIWFIFLLEDFNLSRTFFDKSSNNTEHICGKSRINSKECPNQVFRYLTIITDSANYDLQYGIKYQIPAKDGRLRYMIIDNISSNIDDSEFEDCLT